MKRTFVLFVAGLIFLASVPMSRAADATPPPAASARTDDTGGVAQRDAEAHQHATEAVAAGQTGVGTAPRAPDFLEHLVDSVLSAFNIRTSGNTVTHYAISALLLIVALLARRIVTRIIFPILRKLASKTQTTLDDKLFPAFETPVAALVMLVGIFASLRVLKLSDDADYYIAKGSTGAFSLVLFWGLWRALLALLDHAHEVAKAKSLGVAAFMPWIKKTIVTVFIVLGVLLTIQALGYDVKAILAGLGIGGLAFALAAQDTLANVFGAVVVAIDQPFKLGEVVRIQGNIGFIEDIGVRSTRIRLIDGCLMVIPNKTVAGETITNFSRFIRRHFEQIISLTYDTPPAHMDAMVAEIRGIIAGQPEVDPASVLVFFRDLSASSLDIWVVYNTREGDFIKAMTCKQRINLLIMKAVEARGLSFAFPTQTVHLEGEVAEKLAGRG